MTTFTKNSVREEIFILIFQFYMGVNVKAHKASGPAQYFAWQVFGHYLAFCGCSQVFEVVTAGMEACNKCRRINDGFGNEYWSRKILLV